MGPVFRSITPVFPARGGGSTNFTTVSLRTLQQNKTSLPTFAPNMRLELQKVVQCIPGNLEQSESGIHLHSLYRKRWSALLARIFLPLQLSRNR